MFFFLCCIYGIKSVVIQYLISITVVLYFDNIISNGWFCNYLVGLFSSYLLLYLCGFIGFNNIVIQFFHVKIIICF